MEIFLIKYLFSFFQRIFEFYFIRELCDTLQKSLTLGCYTLFNYNISTFYSLSDVSLNKFYIKLAILPFINVKEYRNLNINIF
jgi:hypothetical protein